MSLFAQFEQLARLYAKTGETVDATFFPIEPVVLAKSIAFKCSNPLLVSAVRSFFQRRGERGQLALDFMERVTAKKDGTCSLDSQGIGGIFEQVQNQTKNSKRVG